MASIMDHEACQALNDEIPFLHGRYYATESTCQSGRAQFRRANLAKRMARHIYDATRVHNLGAMHPSAFGL
jgi:hypothetical protein